MGRSDGGWMGRGGEMNKEKSNIFFLDLIDIYLVGVGKLGPHSYLLPKSNTHYS